MYLCPNAYLLPANTAMTRHITGAANGTYDYHSIVPGGTSVTLEGVPTATGEADTLLVNADGTQIRFEPGAEKSFALTVGRDATDATQQVRGIAVDGVVGTPAAAVDVTLSPDLSMLRVGNRASDTTVSVRALGMDADTAQNATNNRGNLSLPTNTDLTVAVTDWDALDMTVRTVPFDG
jgi:hypothetical protein